MPVLTLGWPSVRWVGRLRKNVAALMSFGTKPSNTPNSLGYNIFNYRSKSWAEFVGPKAPEFDFVFTVCDNAAAEPCPAWPGQPMTAHWGIPDPAEATGTPAEVSLAFKEAYRLLNQRIGTFAPLPLHSLKKLALESKLREIGQMEGATAKAAEKT
jgi:arsenate reductase